MHHMHIVAHGEGQVSKAFALARYVPGQGYSLMCDRAQLAEFLGQQDHEDTEHLLVITVEAPAPPKESQVTRRSAPPRQVLEPEKVESPKVEDKGIQAGPPSGTHSPAGTHSRSPETLSEKK